MVLASIFLAKPLAKLWKREKITPARAGTFVFLVWSTHVLIDCFTVYGTSVLWPFSKNRIALNNLFIIDPLYTLPILISLVWLAFLRTKKQQKKRTKVLAWGLGISTAYVALSFGFKFLASSAFDADLQHREVTYTRRMEAPTPFNTLLWRSVVDTGDDFWIGYRSVLEFGDKPIRWTVYPKQKQTIAPYADQREIQTLEWFSRGWWIARPHAKGIWLADMRFGETRAYDAKPGMVDSRFRFSWSFQPEAEGDRLTQPKPKVKDPGKALKRLGLRILGKTDQWEANPRLAGIPGTLPEFLPAVE